MKQVTAHPTHAFGNRRPLFSHQALPCAVLWINGMAALVCNASCTKESPTLRLSQPVTAARHVVAPAKLLVVHALVHSVKTSAHIFPPPPPPYSSKSVLIVVTLQSAEVQTDRCTGPPGYGLLCQPSLPMLTMPFIAPSHILLTNSPSPLSL